MDQIDARDGQRDFDFFFGSWRARHHRLRGALTGSDEWYDFETTCDVRPLWYGKGNVEEHLGMSPAGPFEGMTLRLYDAASRNWSLYWATPQHGLVTVPTVGRFDENGVGDFSCEELFNGVPIICRFRWHQQWGDGCRWEQAFSTDRGATWETNWVMDFTRV